MLFFLILTALPFIASAAAAPSSITFEQAYTSFPIGCHNFEGKVSCGNGNSALPSARVILYEKDFLTADDHLVEVPFQNGIFKIHKCATDFPTPNLELYFRFFEVCQSGDEKYSGILKENVSVDYVFFDNEKFAHTAINDNN